MGREEVVEMVMGGCFALVLDDRQEDALALARL